MKEKKQKEIRQLPLNPDTEKCIKELLLEVEFRRKLLKRKIPLELLEKPFTFTMK